MVKEIYGKKIGMTQIFDENGNAVPVTVVEATPCTIIQKKTVEKEGYNALVVAFGAVKEKNLNKPQKGIFAKVNLPIQKHIREIRLENGIEEFEIGTEITVTNFEIGDDIDVQGISKGKGFAGTIKRHNGHRGPMTHGSMYHRRPGSMGAHTDPGRVFKNKKLPGHMGQETSTVQNVSIVKVDAEKNLLLVKGSIPGAKNSLVRIKQAVK